MANVTLASGQITAADQLSVELVQAIDTPPVILIRWPAAPRHRSRRLPGRRPAVIAIMDEAMIARGDDAGVVVAHLVDQSRSPGNLAGGFRMQPSRRPAARLPRQTRDISGLRFGNNPCPRLLAAPIHVVIVGEVFAHSGGHSQVPVGRSANPAARPPAPADPPTQPLGPPQQPPMSPPPPPEVVRQAKEKRFGFLALGITALVTGLITCRCSGINAPRVSGTTTAGPAPTVTKTVTEPAVVEGGGEPTEEPADEKLNRPRSRPPGTQSQETSRSVSRSWRSSASARPDAASPTGSSLNTLAPSPSLTKGPLR